MNFKETLVFRNREEAGHELAKVLSRFQLDNPLVLGIPRGAVPMAKVVAEELGGELDVILVHKVGFPGHPEFAIGSVTEEGDILLGAGARRHGFSLQDIEEQAMREIRELHRKRVMFTPHRRPVDVEGRDVIVVDDGIATGSTMSAAVRSLMQREAGRVVVATPVASKEAVDRLEDEGAEVVSLLVPESFFAVGQFYEDFSQVSDEEVTKALGSESPEITIQRGHISLKAILTVPDGARGLVIFAHGSGSGRRSPRNQFVANTLNKGRIATLLADLLFEGEEDTLDRRNVFDIDLLASRLLLLTEWVRDQTDLSRLPVGYFGASTGAAAALRAASLRSDASVSAVVSRGGRPDLAGDEALNRVVAPTLLIVGGEDYGVIELNQSAFEKLGALDNDCKRIEVIPGATHLFEEPGALEQVADLALDWFLEHLANKRLSRHTRDEMRSTQF